LRWAKHHQTPRHCPRSPGSSLNPNPSSTVPNFFFFLPTLYITRRSKTLSLVFEHVNNTTWIDLFFSWLFFFSQRHHPWSSSTSTTRTSKCCTPRSQTWTSGNDFYWFHCI
jgi:hypothetical protein